MNHFKAVSLGPEIQVLRNHSFGDTINVPSLKNGFHIHEKTDPKTENSLVFFLGGDACRRSMIYMDSSDPDLWMVSFEKDNFLPW